MVLEVLGIAILFPIVKIITTEEIPFKEIIPLNEDNFTRIHNYFINYFLF